MVMSGRFALGWGAVTIYRHLGIADGMSIAMVWACRYSKWPPRRGGHFEYRHAPNPRNGHAVGDADMVKKMSGRSALGWYAWAVGMGPLFLPDGVGFQVGDTDPDDVRWPK